jgi:hypothetical protein
MDFMGIALSAIAIGTVVMVGYYLVSKISASIPTPTLSNGSTDTTAQTGIDNAKNTVFSGFSLITVGVIVLAAFGIIAIFS